MTVLNFPQSTAIESAVMEDGRFLVVRYRSGGEYTYYMRNPAQALYSLMDAESPGRCLHDMRTSHELEEAF